jgi:hypothetical protein
MMMALQKLAAILVRARGASPLAVSIIAVVTIVGCAKNRQSYRPVYAMPAPVSTPCKNCEPGTAIIPDGPAGDAISPVPSLVEPPVTDTPAAGANGSSRPGTGATRSSTVEKPPTSRLGGEPPFDPTAVPSNSGGSDTPPSPPKPVGPALQGPTTSVSPSRRGPASGAMARVDAPGAQRVRRASLSQELRPFLDDPSASELAYPNKADRPWRYIVLHHSATAGGNYDQIDAEHRKVLGFDGCGYHFVIGNGTGSGDGQIEVAQRWTNQKQGVHCRNARSHDVDEYGIGICLVGDLDQSPPTPRQIAAAQALVAYLSQRYSITQGRIASHAHVATTTTVCPGKYFPNDAILTLKSAAMDTRPVPTSWRVLGDSSASN